MMAAQALGQRPTGWDYSEGKTWLPPRLSRSRDTLPFIGRLAMLALPMVLMIYRRCFLKAEMLFFGVQLQLPRLQPGSHPAPASCCYFLSAEGITSVVAALARLLLCAVQLLLPQTRFIEGFRSVGKARSASSFE